MGGKKYDEYGRPIDSDGTLFNWMRYVIVPIVVALIGAGAVTIVFQPQIIFGDNNSQNSGGTTINATIIPTQSIAPTSIADTAVPSQASETRNFYPLALTQSINNWTNYLGVNSGSIAFEDVPYIVGNELNTSGCRPEINANQVTVSANINHPKAIYVLINAGNGFRQYENMLIGQLRFNFETGEFVYDLVLGENLRDWATTPESDVVTGITTPDTEVSEIWSGTAYDGRIGRIDRIMIPIPNPYTNQILVSIDVIDLSGIGTSNEPCLQIQAITVEAD